MTTEPKPSTYDNSALMAEDEGYHKGLKPRQLQMIAIGGAIGTGLFLGAGGRLHNAGPGLFLSYAFCGIFVFLILRALGELVLHRPSSGSFVSYAREFLGEKAAFVAGWMYWLNWAFTAIVDSTAIATYFHYWKTFGERPAVADRTARAGGRGEHKPHFRDPVRGARVLGCGHQSPCADDVFGRRHHLSRGPLPHSRAVNRFQRDRQQRRDFPPRPLPAGDRHVWRRVCLCRSRTRRNSGR